MKAFSFPKTTFLISELADIRIVIQHIQIPIYFFFIFAISSLFIPGELKTLSKDQELNNIKIKNFTLQSAIDSLIPMNRRISIYFNFREITKKEYFINGGIFVACFKDGISVFNFTGLIPKFEISENSQIKIFQDFNIDYDTINTTIRIEQKPVFAKYFQITWVFYNQQFVLYNITVKFILLIIFIQLILYFSKKMKTSSNISIEQRLTLMLLIIAIAYINPLYFSDLFVSSQFIHLLSIFLIDIFYSFLYFYFLSMFSLFIAESKFDCFNRLILLVSPYCFFIISSIILLRKDLNIFSIKDSISILPDFPKSFDDLSDWKSFSPTHLKIFYCFCFFCFLCILILAFCYQKKQKSKKFIYYICIFVFTIFIINLNQSSSFHSYSIHGNALFSLLEYFSILLSVMLCAYGQIDAEYY